MRTTVLRGLATVLGLAAIGVLGAGTAPARAAASDCPRGYFCAWKNESATGTMFKTDTDKATLGTWDDAFRSFTNRTSAYACLYEDAGYEVWGGYASLSPDGPGEWGAWPTATTSSIRFVRTERECGRPAYPAWHAETAPTAAGFGDLNGDLRADGLSRDEAGRLWFLPGDGTGRLVGSGGWNGMNALTRHGDFSRDGREDLIAREASSGKLWLYPGTGSGGFGARRVIGTGGWNGMSNVTASGDLSGDGRSDLLAVEKSTGKLWMYPGTAAGGLGARKLVGSGGWNSMNALMGAGDMDGDGRPDLVAREASTGKLWRYPGGTATLASRTLIGGGGWNAMDTFIAVGDYSGDGHADLATVTHEQYRIDGHPGHLGWLLTYRGQADGSLAAGERTDGEWWGLNGAF
ncbi:FG-GAP-like repeat-containing protein [Streptomyces sp. NPDC046182]|uniref:FG-GAP-like repeat-containing protein n=1 Tax=Streptomyces sp. NPDC046182 TaxID=3154601 RepID=UPI0033F6D6E8